MSPDGFFSEAIAYSGMILILGAFLLETRDVLDSKNKIYLLMMASGSGLLAIRALLIDEWAFLILGNCLVPCSNTRTDWINYKIKQ